MTPQPQNKSNMDNTTNNISSWLGEYGCNVIKQYGAQAYLDAVRTMVNNAMNAHGMQQTAAQVAISRAEALVTCLTK